MTICTVTGCASRVLARGWCNKHYYRWRKYGSPTEPLHRLAGRICGIEGCAAPHAAKGLCRKHYLRQGDPAAVRPHEMTPEERFWSKVTKTQDCWLWTGSRNTGGYGRFALTHKDYVAAHRYAYVLTYGPIPVGLELDHVKARGCRYRHCVNPDHLEPVTARENVMRSDGVAAVNARKAMCVAGHPLEGANLYIRPNGKRECIACRTLRKRRDRQSGN